MESPIKELRKNLRYTQRELAAAAGDTQGHISDVEKGLIALDHQLIDFLELVGIDSAEIEQKQKEYMEETKKQLIERAKTRSHKGGD